MSITFHLWFFYLFHLTLPVFIWDLQVQIYYCRSANSILPCNMGFLRISSCDDLSLHYGYYHWRLIIERFSFEYFPLSRFKLGHYSYISYSDWFIQTLNYLLWQLSMLNIDHSALVSLKGYLFFLCCVFLFEYINSLL